MKYTRRIMGVLLALMMVMGLMTATALAAETTYKYEIYQIFTGDYSEGILSNVKWGADAQLTEGAEAGGAVPPEVLEKLEALNEKSDNEKLEVITQYANLNSTSKTTHTANELTTTISNLANGYYLVKDEDNSQTGEYSSYTTYVVKVVDGTMSITRKADAPEVDKVIVDGSEVKTNEASIGDSVNYKITGELPTNLADFDTYYYKFTDTLSAGLTYNNDMKVYLVNDTEETKVTQYFFINATAYDTTNGTTITVAIQDLLALNNVEGLSVDKDTKIVLEYSAVLNENAKIGTETGNPNDVKLDYSNDPNNSGDGTTTAPPTNPSEEPTVPSDQPTGETPKKDVITYTTELTITKKIGDTDEILPGAEFTLTSTNGAKVALVSEEVFTESTDGTYYKLNDGTYTTKAPTEETKDAYASTETKYTKGTVLTVKGAGKGEGGADTSITGAVDSETGKLTFTGLGVGEYTLTETKTPAGYNTIEPITFTICFDAAEKKFSTSDDSISVNETNGTLSMEVQNYAGSTLPETGGMGTTLFYIVGGLLVAAAVVLLVTKRRMGAAE